jgi:undecaprenyl-diphosphatase
LASGLYQFAKTYQDLEPANLAATALGTLVSFLVGYAVIVALLRYLNRGSFMPFVVWRIVLGVAVLLGLITGALVA